MKKIRLNPANLIRNTLRILSNLRRSLRRRGLETIVLTLHGSYPECPAPRDPLPFPLNLLPILPSPDPSLSDLEEGLNLIGGDSRVQNVVLKFQSLQADMATRYSMRRALGDLQEQGKHLLAWLPDAGMGDYYLATACDEILLPPAAHMNLLGLRLEAVFLKDVLDMIGVEPNFEHIAEYKTAPDMFRRTTMSDAQREMLNAILDDVYDEIVSAIAEGRGLEPDRVRALIDQMPLTAAEALEAGLADGVCYEDEIATRLAPERPEEGPEQELEKNAKNKKAEAPSKPVAWQEAARWLRLPRQRRTRQKIGIISLQGMIVPGPSRRSPFPLPLPDPYEAQAGAETIAQALRNAEADEGVAAVIFHVESPGGSPLGSDLIWREVLRLRQRKPVVVLMGSQAASGGYYVAAAADRIVARPTTLTGSIGIWGGKFSTAELYEKLGIGREAVQRGAMAGLHSEMSPFSEEERDRIRRQMETTYALFKSRVAEGREMTAEAVEEVARGRVWSGRRAQEVGLVDEIGDFETALEIAKELASLDPGQDYTTLQIAPAQQTLLAPPFRRSEKTALWNSQNSLLDMLRALTCERIWALSPWIIQLRG
ncbi:MAG TPA: signal peptide peptidase SppA [Chloroflexi bacterium]|nr:signal peptide peptidase SppA [Chloroflexota bacterium]